jgi:Flp pilus assembly protein TadD
VKRLLVLPVLLLAAVFALLIYTAAAREGTYRRLLAQGEAALAEDQTFAAIEAFSGAIALKGDSMLAYLRRGETYRQRGDLSAALRDLRTAARLDPSAPHPLAQLGDINYALHRYGRAAERYAEYVQLDDRAPAVLYKLALARYREGSVGAAIDPLRRAVALDDRFAEAHYLLGLCLRDVDLPQDAADALERAVALSPGLVHAREELADLYRSLERRGDEIDQLAVLATLDGSRPHRQVDLGLAFARAGRLEQAVLALSAAIERHPQHTQAYVALGRVWLQAAGVARPDRVALNKAFEALEHAAITEPGSEALTLLGRARLLGGDLEGAAAALQRAAGKLPVDPEAYLWLAEVAERRGRLADARMALVHYEALVPGGAPARHIAHATRIAGLSLELDDPVTAVAWLERAAALAPPEPALLGRLADAYWRTGNEEGARLTLAEALKADPRDPSLLGLQRRIH